MENKHTLTRVTKTAFEELNRIKKITGLPHSAVMKLAINRDINEQDLLNSRLEAARHHVRIKQVDLDSLKSLNAFGLDLARLLSIKINKLKLEMGV
ncbi:hypothetical protein C5896_003717 [Escherichia coli O19]|uniref:hypothetical protein n=1 Tax=Escherichia coli TaxID=562 RepID=UPI000B7D2261|nr:hypothetical protein [Escherichia coli]EFA4306796.1 hypothetical protein [Escherichia coli O19]EFO1847410.1 hypothetical protein [Escherichia coli]MDW6166103.1 hypothetical protein [Escherichia coli]HCP8273773.1 hypothetical protein [Escherichia coli]HDO7339240.1 hypothetical protein [Escherichia coli]